MVETARNTDGQARAEERPAGQTPWQTVGPFFHYGLPWKGGADLVGQSELGARLELIPEGHDLLNRAPAKGEVAGERIEIVGHVFDADGRPIPDAMIEIWQANAAGRYASDDDRRDSLPLDEGFTGFGRAATDAEGAFRFLTVRPGRTPGPGNSLQAPHIAVGVFGRGLLKRLVTRIYFMDDPANGEDPILDLVAPERRGTLLARPDGQGRWRFDIHLQGEDETVFFAF